VNSSKNALVTMPGTLYKDIKNSLTRLYVEDKRPWLVGFSGGKDSTMLASLIFEAVLSIPPADRKKPISVLCTIDWSCSRLRMK
jgi:DNA sulfur modification protein DndC